MAKQLLIYDTATPVNPDTHRDVSVKMAGTYAFARNVNSVPIVAAEFLAAASDCVIVFAGTAEAVFPAVLLGLEPDHNEYLDDQNRWSGRYVPAFLRRYPFVFAQNPETDQLTLCIDDTFEGVNTDGKGERLFDSEGARSSYLEAQLSFATQYQNQYLRTKAFCDRLLQLDVLEPAVANFTGDDSQPRRLSGFFRISREKLKKISPEVLGQMFHNDELELCYVHLQSFNNIETLGIKLAANTAKGQSLQ
ncbi:multidrug transporter [Thioclava sp. SK-1]|uniref:SapC family protein n=1 Tax=Thioclava sp. SK-1 TaxID=1889770 RepID=UPI0008247DBA|nr:SapC family protein [Thioclava sp. SK-1]OCX64517.1 multidrug transporter [Thioclava sp. SK-1]